MPKRGGKRKKTRTHLDNAPAGAHVLGEGSLKEDVPKSIVAKASKVRNISTNTLNERAFQPTYSSKALPQVYPNVVELVLDVRKLMNPNTANSLRERSYNKMKDYTAVAGQLGVSHLLAFSQTSSNIVLRISKFPTGPTLHFRVQQFTLSKAIRSAQRRPFDSAKAYMSAPLVVLNGFGQSNESHVKLMRAAFQNMFPTITIDSVKLSDCRRVVLFHYCKEDGFVEVRHYAVRANPVGVSRGVKKILQARIPDLGKLEDVSEFVEGGGGAASDSEVDEDSSKVILPDKFVGRGNSKAQQSAMKLIELGPRMKLELFKVERGVCEGDVLFHKFEQKSPEEAEELKRRIEKAKLLKQQRKAEQDANVQKKRASSGEDGSSGRGRKRGKAQVGDFNSQEDYSV